MIDFKEYKLVYVEKKHELGSIYTLQFSTDGALPFKAGQWLHLGFPTEEKDKSKVRHMSISSAPQDKYIEFTMDLSSGTWYKSHMMALKPGDVLRGFKIKGDFCVSPEVENEIVFLSGGIGITPVHSVVRDLNYKNATVNWSLFHVARSGFLFEEEFKAFKNDQWRVHRNQIDDYWHKIIQKPDDTKYYLSGSDRFVEGMKEKLALSGIMPMQIVTESFL